MKNILPWILVVVLAACVGALYFSGSAQKTELTTLRGQAGQLDSVNSQLEELQKKAAAQDEQIATMQKDNAELLKLRNQVRQMGDENTALTKKLAAAQSQAERSQAEVQNVQARVSENIKALQEQQIMQQKQNQAVVITCINNLRTIDGAKQQWALQNQKSPDAVPTMQDIVPYLPNNQVPQCPGGGRYTLNAVKIAPTCSIVGHNL